MALVVGTSFTSSRRPMGTPRFPTTTGTSRQGRVGKSPNHMSGMFIPKQEMLHPTFSDQQGTVGWQKSGFSVFFPFQLFRDGKFKFLQALVAFKDRMEWNHRPVADVYPYRSQVTQNAFLEKTNTRSPRSDLFQLHRSQ